MVAIDQLAFQLLTNFRRLAFLACHQGCIFPLFEQSFHRLLDRRSLCWWICSLIRLVEWGSWLIHQSNDLVKAKLLGLFFDFFQLLWIVLTGTTLWHDLHLSRLASNRQLVTFQLLSAILLSKHRSLNFFFGYSVIGCILPFLQISSNLSAFMPWD